MVPESHKEKKQRTSKDAARNISHVERNHSDLRVVGVFHKVKAGFGRTSEITLHDRDTRLWEIEAMGANLSNGLFGNEKTPFFVA